MVDVSETLATIERLSEIANDVSAAARDLRVACRVYPRSEKLAADHERFRRAVDDIWNAIELLVDAVGTVP